MASAIASINVTNDELRLALSAALKSYPGPHNTDRRGHFRHTSPDINGKPTEIFAFPGSHNLGDWVTNFEFKQCMLSDVHDLQPHFAGVSTLVHKGFAERLGIILQTKTYREKLDAAVAANKRIIFTGHSLGGAVATLAALTLLYRRVLQKSQPLPLSNDYPQITVISRNPSLIILRKPSSILAFGMSQEALFKSLYESKVPCMCCSHKTAGAKSNGKSALDMVCCTFAAPLVGELALGKAVAENGWDAHFITVVARHDIVPRLLLSPAKVLTSTPTTILQNQRKGAEKDQGEVPMPKATLKAAGTGPAD